MPAWIRDISLKHKFWAVNAVAFVTTLLLTLFAMLQEQETYAQAMRAARYAVAVAEEMTRSVIGIRDVTERTVQQTLASATTSSQLAQLAGELSRVIRQLKT